MKLLKIKDFHKPISLSNIKEHSKKTKSLLDMNISSFK
jgi:hypothetical protein